MRPEDVLGGGSVGLVSPQVHVDLPMIWLPAVTTAASAQTAFAQQFLWIPNLASHDPLYIMPVLAALFQFLSQRMSIPFGYSKTAGEVPLATDG